MDDSEFLDGGFLFSAKGAPVPQPRPRFVNGRVISTLDMKAQMWKNRVRASCLDAMKSRINCAHTRDFKALGGCLRVDMVFVMPTKVKGRHGLPCGLKPDKDNLEKLVLDAMQSCKLFKDDGQASAGDIQKFWTEDESLAGVHVTLSRHEGKLFEFRPEKNPLGF